MSDLKASFVSPFSTSVEFQLGCSIECFRVHQGEKL